MQLMHRYTKGKANAYTKHSKSLNYSDIVDISINYNFIVWVVWFEMVYLTHMPDICVLPRVT